MSRTALMRMPGQPEEAVKEKQILTISETVARSREKGMPISEYTLRRAVRSGAIPCRVVGKTYLIAWRNVEHWLLCDDGQDNPPVADRGAGYGQIRRIEVGG